MDWEKIINWDEVPEDMRIYQHRKTKALHTGPVSKAFLENSHFEEIKRPVKLEDGEWYTFTYYGDKKAGIFCKHDDYFQVGTTFYYIKDVEIHKKLTDDMWK